MLSAGAVKSPQLLMLSGVGPAEHLGRLGIPIVHDLPGVGRSFKDHPLIQVRMSVKEGVQMDPNAPRLQTGLHYTAEGSSTRGDMQILPSSFATPLGEDPNQTPRVALSCILNQPVSIGELRLTSTDPYVQPYLDYKYLEDPWDRKRLRVAVRLCIRLLEHEAFRDIVAYLVSPTEQDLASDEALDAWLLTCMGTAIHMSGTCKMGPSSDPMAVVDQYCRVYGLEGVRVVDTSVMPDVVRRATNAAAVLIGERVAEWFR